MTARALTLSELWIYPVKSLAGVRVARADVEARGLAGDRRFLVVDERGRFLTQRELPAMALARPRLERGLLRLEAPGLASVEVPSDVDGPAREVVVWEDRVEAIDAGDEIAEWISAALARPARLVRMPESTRRAADPKHARPGDLVSFADGFPFLLATEASLLAVNEALDVPVDVRRFRPNLVVAGAEPFEEDAWREVRIGGVRFYPRKACARCAIVDVDPDAGARAGGVLTALATVRREGNAVYFGQNLVHDGAGTLRVGDEVVVA